MTFGRGWRKRAGNRGGEMGGREHEAADLLSPMYASAPDQPLSSTARENGSRGTDHGHAHAMFVLGRPVNGGKVYGDWPGLKDHQHHDGRDLALTTGFRDVFAEVAMRHLGVEDPAGIFPGYAVSPARFRGFLG